MLNPDIPKIDTVLMTHKNKKLTETSIIIGVFTCIGYLFQDFLFNKFWLVSWFLIIVLSVWLLINLVNSVAQKNTRSILLNITFILFVSAICLSKIEYFKSERVLEATLVDDLSSINLILRKNKTFEITSNSIFGEEQPFKGNYKIEGDKIIFLSSPYYNSFIPDTVLILGDKIILNGDLRKPDTSFAAYFKIKNR